MGGQGVPHPVRPSVAPRTYRALSSMQAVSFDEAVELILKRDPRFNREAYYFVREALDYTQKTL